MEDSDAEYIFFTIFIMNLPIMWASIFIVLSNSTARQNKALQNLTLVIFSITVTWGIPTLSPLIRFFVGGYSVIFDYIAMFLGCISGITLCAARIGSLQMMAKMKEFLKQQVKKDLTRGITAGRRLTTNSLVINEGSLGDMTIGSFFESFTRNTVRDIIIGLELIYNEESCPVKNEFSLYDKRKYQFNSCHFTALENRIGRNMFSTENRLDVWEYHSDIFANIRNNCGWGKEKICEALSNENNFKKLENANTGGRSNAFIFSTFNDELIVKTVTKEEKYLLLSMLKKYNKRVEKYPESRIVRILGLYKVKSSKHSFILMENLVKAKENAVIFDLKGSLQNRYTEPSKDLTGVVMKDQNFIEMGKKLQIESIDQCKLIKSIQKDAKFFKKLKIIDYSLLVAVYTKEIQCDNRYFIKGLNGNYYSLGIIDFLQAYNLSKKCELAYKKLKCQKNLSVSPPGKYSSRFIDFISNIFL